MMSCLADPSSEDGVSQFLLKPDHRKLFRLGLLNMRSLREKFWDINFLPENQLLDVLVVCETWFNASDCQDLYQSDF